MPEEECQVTIILVIILQEGGGVDVKRFVLVKGSDVTPSAHRRLKGLSEMAKSIFREDTQECRVPQVTGRLREVQ
ncbi:hypothetical protein EV2_002967 [Malus domestica]